jgi:hypothetical protein
VVEAAEADTDLMPDGRSTTAEAFLPEFTAGALTRRDRLDAPAVTVRSPAPTGRARWYEGGGVKDGEVGEPLPDKEARSIESASERISSREPRERDVDVADPYGGGGAAILKKQLCIRISYN